MLTCAPRRLTRLGWRHHRDEVNLVRRPRVRLVGVLRVSQREPRRVGWGVFDAFRMVLSQSLRPDTDWVEWLAVLIPETQADYLFLLFSGWNT